MADDSELDYIDTFLTALHTGYTVQTIETTRNINLIADTQSVLVFAGETMGSTILTVIRRYPLQYRDTTEGNLNAAFYALNEGIRKLNARDTIAGYTKPTSLVGMKLVSGGKDYYQIKSGSWYGNISIEAEWLTTS